MVFIFGSRDYDEIYYECYLGGMEEGRGKEGGKVLKLNLGTKRPLGKMLGCNPENISKQQKLTIFAFTTLNPILGAGGVVFHDFMSTEGRGVVQNYPIL